MSTEAKTPQPGEFWIDDKSGARMLCHGITRVGLLIFETAGGNIFSCCRLESSWQHAPWCTSWDSVEPKEQEWFDLTSMAGHKLRAEIDEVLNPNNVWIPINASRGMTVGRIKETTHYTHFRCKIEHAPKAVTPPVESPDDWVTQDRVSARPETDQERWFDKHGTPTGGWKESTGCSLYHGDKGGTDFRLELRCRRKDLPPIEQKAEREVYLYWYDGNVVGRYADCPPQDPSFTPLVFRDGRVFIPETREVNRG